MNIENLEKYEEPLSTEDPQIIRYEALDQSLVSEYADSIAFMDDFKKTLVKHPPQNPLLAADISSEQLHHVLRFNEMFLRAGYIKTAPRLNGIDAQTSGRLYEIAMYKVLFEGLWRREGQPPVTIEEWEKILSETFSLKDLYLLLRMSLEGGEAYAPIVAKLLHILKFGPNFGEEIKDVASDGGAKNFIVIYENSQKLPEAFGKLALDPHEAIRRVAWNIGYKHKTLYRKISGPALFLAQNLGPGKNLKKLYEENFSDLVWWLADALHASCYQRDGEIFTEQNHQELIAMCIATASIKFLEEIKQDGTSDRPGDRENILIETQKLYDATASYLIENFGEEWRTRLTARMEERAFHHETLPGDISDFLKAFPGQILAIQEAHTMPDSEQMSHLFETFGFKAIFGQGNHIYSLEETPEDKAKRFRFPLARQYAFIALKPYIDLQPPPGIERKQEIILPELVFTGLNSLIEHSDSPFELIEYIQAILSRGKTRESRLPLDAAFAKLQKHQEFFEFCVENTAAIAEDKKHEAYTPMGKNELCFEFFEEMFAPARREKNLPLFHRLLALLVKPDARTFYQGCGILAFLLEQEKGDGPLTRLFLESFFTQPADFTNPIRLAVLRNMAERLRDSIRVPLLEAFVRHPQFPDDQSEKIFQLLSAQASAVRPIVDGRLKKLKTRRRIEEERKKLRAPLEFLQSLSANEYPARDTTSLKDKIKAHRTIQMNPDGHDIELQQLPIGSRLLTFFPTARVRRNKETGNPPEGLACNITLYNHSGLGIHFRLTVDGELIFRLLDKDGQTTQEITKNKLQAIGISESLFQELHYLALEILKFIYVRTENVPGPGVPGASDASLSPRESTGVLPASGPVAFAPGLPLTPEREIGEMTIDLTDRARKIQTDRERVQRVFIETNLARVMEVFAPLARDVELPETPSQEIASLALHRTEILNPSARPRKSDSGEKIFRPLQNPLEVYEAIRTGAMKPEDLYVRTGRAFAQPLPYRHTIHRVRNEPGTPDYNPAKPDTIYLHLPEAKRPDRKGVQELKQLIFEQEEKGEAFDLSPLEHVLSFDVERRDDRPWNQQMYERLRLREGMPLDIQIMEWERKIDARISQVRREAREKYLETEAPDLFAYAEAMAKVEATVLDVAQRVKKIQEWVTDHASPDGSGRRLQTRYRLPQDGFKFNQTFNQGRFKSLQEIIDEMRGRYESPTA